MPRIHYRSIANEWAGKDRKTLAEVERAATKTPYQTWSEGAAQRRQDHDAAVRTLRAIGHDPAEIERFRKIFEDTERDVAERLKAEESDHRKMQQDLVGGVHASLDSLRADVETMGSEWRRRPAYITAAQPGGLNATGSSLVPEDGLYVFRGLELNHDFWRARTSPVEVRSIHVKLSNSLGCTRPAIQKAVWAAYKTLDWAAFDRMLHVPAGEKSWRGGVSHELSDNP